MGKIYESISAWLLQLGMSEGLTMILLRAGAVLAILAVAFIIDGICRKLIVPIVRKITLKTESKWDDYLLNDAMCSAFTIVCFSSLSLSRLI